MLPEQSILIMKTDRGASAIFYLIVGVAFVIVLLAAPYPHFELDSKAWFLGPSIGNRVTGGGSSQGVPMDKVVTTVTSASVTSPLDIKCIVDTDCKAYVVANQCVSYCGNLSSENQSAVTLLNNRRVCDPSLWDSPTLDCSCVAGRCVSFTN